MAGKNQTRRSGQIVKRGENKFLVRIFLGKDTDGKRNYFSQLIKGSKKDADKYLAKKLNEKNLGEFIEPAAMSLNVFLEKWLNEVARIKVRQSTFDGYEFKIKRHVKNTIGKKRLRDLEAFDIQKLYNDMSKSGLSAKSIRHLHNIINPALKQAIKWKLIKHNPCELCELPKLVRHEMQYFTKDEVSIFLEHAKSDRYYAAFVLAIETGMRIGEYLGLKWQDIDFENSRLSVRRGLVPKKGGGFAFTEPKTARSVRSIPLTQSTISILKEHRRKQFEQKMPIREVYEELDLVFPTEIGTPTLDGNLDKRHFKKIIKAANDAITKTNTENGEYKPLLKAVRLYDLRHTCATLLLSKGVNPKVVSERLGHSSIALTLDIYSHVLPDMQNEATGIMEDLIFGT